jgi:RNA polymerase sigma factor (sigma-70 family)
MVLRRCRFLLGNDSEAEDAMHDVFVNLIRKESDLESTYPCSLLFIMATNISLDRIRARKRRAENPNDEILLEITDTVDLEEVHRDRSFIRFIFSKENHASRESTQAMAVMHFVDGMTFEEVGKAVGMSAIGVRKRLQGFRQRARSLKET